MADTIESIRDDLAAGLAGLGMEPEQARAYAEESTLRAAAKKEPSCFCGYCEEQFVDAETLEAHLSLDHGHNMDRHGIVMDPLLWRVQPSGGKWVAFANSTAVPGMFDTRDEAAQAAREALKTLAELPVADAATTFAKEALDLRFAIEGATEISGQLARLRVQLDGKQAADLVETQAGHSTIHVPAGALIVSKGAELARAMEPVEAGALRLKNAYDRLQREASLKGEEKPPQRSDITTRADDWARLPRRMVDRQAPALDLDAAAQAAAELSTTRPPPTALVPFPPMPPEKPSLRDRLWRLFDW